MSPCVHAERRAERREQRREERREVLTSPAKVTPTTGSMSSADPMP